MPQKNKPAGTAKRSTAKKGLPEKTYDSRQDVEKIVSPEAGIPIKGIGGSVRELERLREAEERNRLLTGVLQSSSDGILAVNRENEVLFANARFVEMWMIPQEVMATGDDTRLLDFVLAQLSDPQGFLRKVQELYGAAQESFDTLYFKDGRIFDRLSRPILQGTELRGRVWSFRDMTDRRRIEDALAASETELRALFASMHDVVLVIDRDGVYLKVAPTKPGLLYKPPEELLGSNLKDIFPSEQAEFFCRVMQQVIDTKQNSQVEYELIIDGRTVWFQTTISPLNADSTLWVAHDITNRKQMEEALRSAEENYRLIFANAIVGIFQSTPEGRFLSINPVMAHIFGYNSPKEMLESVVNIEIQDYVDPADRREFQRLMIEHGEVHEFVSLNKRKDGSYIWVQENARAVKDDKGNILHYEGFITDVTERKKAEEELRYAKEGLESAMLELQKSLEREKQLASTDGLTGLHNHRHFFELAACEFEASLRYQYPISILMFDMDDFKKVNDSLGHAGGDKLLKMVAQTALAQVRKFDLIARYGGDEFIVLLSHASAQEALSVAERLRTSVAAINGETDKEPLIITLSVGIAESQYDPADENVERVIQRADDALYKAKRSGRNCTMIFGLDETGVA
jgi:diguanylate cyclase (GGDEF)-like protein/PAS domain S-box-containing protein